MGGAADLFEIAPDGLAVALQHLGLVTKVVDVVPIVGEVPVLSDDPQSPLLAATGDPERRVWLL